MATKLREFQSSKTSWRINLIRGRLTLNTIEKSEELQKWLEQFPKEDLPTAQSLLSQLRFISEVEYSKWLLSKLDEYLKYESVAVYSVRKFRNNCQCLWQRNGSTQPRPAQTQGSEDLVASIISNANRQCNNCFLDHPSLQELRKKKIKHIILVDDSIGSGKRVADFIQLMTKHKTFLSWWSFNLFSLHVLSYARTRQSEQLILKRTPGSGHRIRKFPPSSKLCFDGELLYDACNIKRRWGDSSDEIRSLCLSIKKIAADRRQGFGDVMGNIVFYHSVPNTIPGLLYSKIRDGNPFSQIAVCQIG